MSRRAPHVGKMNLASAIFQKLRAGAFGIDPARIGACGKSARESDGAPGHSRTGHWLQGWGVCGPVERAGSRRRYVRADRPDGSDVHCHKPDRTVSARTRIWEFSRVVAAPPGPGGCEGMARTRWTSPAIRLDIRCPRDGIWLLRLHVASAFTALG